MKCVGKQNHIQGEEHGLRRSIPFRLSSILKASNRMDEKVTLAQVSQKYEIQKLNCTKRPNTPLIQAVPQKNKNSVLFLKNVPPIMLKKVQTLKHCKSSLLKVSMQQNYQESIEEKNQEQIDAKLVDLMKMIHQDNKKALNRCQSNVELIVKSSKSPLILNNKKKNNEIFLPEPILSYYCTENHVDHVKNKNYQTPLRNDKKQNKDCQKPLVKSTFLYGPADSKISQKRMSHYVPNKKSQIQQYILCINCETYVNKSLTREHQMKCKGFSVILKKSNSQLIQFLDQKINKKFQQLRQIQSSIKSQNIKHQKVKSPFCLRLYQEKNRIDQILTDLDSIRLKALKKFNTKTLTK